MLYNLSLFSAPISNAEIRKPHICSSLGEFFHCAYQQNISIDNQEMLGLECAGRWFKSGEPFTHVLAMWGDGNWSCFHDYVFRDTSIFPGQYERGYYASLGGSNKPMHFYHLETNTARDFILHR